MAEGPGGAKRARPGGHQLSGEVIGRFQRERILDGAARIIAKRGYRQVTVADIVRSAAIARARFYENFGSKQDCFLALYETARSDAFAAVSEACAAAEDGEAVFALRVKAGIEALLGYLERNPAIAKACVVEGPAVGPPLGEQFEKMVADFAALLRTGRGEEEVAELADTVEETVIGGLYWLLYYALIDGKARDLDQLVPQLTEFALVPFLGAEAARAALA
jgi:AcrR family transcriptional regulator